MPIIIDPVTQVLMDFFADCYGKHEKTELVDYGKWTKKIREASTNHCQVCKRGMNDICERCEIIND